MCGHEPKIALTVEGKWLCERCAAKEELTQMLDTGRAFLYLQYQDGRLTVTNWTGAFSFPVQWSKRSDVCVFGKYGTQRLDVWFTAFGAKWHGKNIGDNDILRCKRVKTRND